MTPQQIDAMKMALEALKNNKLTHLYCEDTWYSCPKHEDGCANEAEGDECNCGADEVNAEFDKVITAIEEALAQPEQEPVLWGVKLSDGKFSPYAHWSKKDAERIALHSHLGTVVAALYTTLPQRKPLTDEQIFVIKHNWITTPFVNHLDFARAIEAAHGIKGDA